MSGQPGVPVGRKVAARAPREGARGALVMLLPGLIVLLGAGAPGPRSLSFEQRVQAQAAIERVYYSHQEGASLPFEQAVPRAVLEKRVRRSLQQSILLDRFWRSPVTEEALRAELDRIARDTRYPDRLREIYAALRHDPFLVEETFARSSLVDRLSRNHFQADARVHAAARREADIPHEGLLSGQVDPRAQHAWRTEAQAAPQQQPDAPAGVPAAPGAGNPARQQGDLQGSLRPGKHASPRRAHVGPIVERPDAFTIEILLAGSATPANYTIPGRSWDEWFEENGSSLQVDDFAPVASGVEPLPAGHGTAGQETAPGGSACVPEDTWDNGILDDPPDPRVGHAAVWTGREMIVWGPGRSGSRYDPLSDTWKSVSQRNAPPVDARASVSEDVAVWTGREMIVWDIQGGPGGAYDPDTDTWRALPSFAPGPGRAVWTGQEIIVYGYLGGGRYDPALDVWKPLPAAGAPGGGAIVWTGQELLAWDPQRRAGGRYNPLSDTWSPISSLNAPIGSDYKAVWTGSFMVVLIGNDATSDYQAGSGQYDPGTDTWTPLEPVQVGHGFSAVWTGKNVIVWGGYDGRPNPESRSDHTAVWTGREMIVWGGITDYGDILATGIRYDPETNVSRPTATTSGGPGAGTGAAFWTGSFVLIWGSGGGGLYDPLTDSWRAVSNAGSPAGMEQAVWTGQELIVWGGAFTRMGVTVQEAGRYDPIMDTWRPLSMTGAPPPLRTPVSVWTGKEMLIWGWACTPLCSVFGGPQGGRYDPLTDIWRPMSTTNAPSDMDRQPIEAYWTGEEMLVWGDQPARYHPEADTWELASTQGAPPHGSRSPAGVWAGHEMIVFDIVDRQDCRSCYAAFRFDLRQDTWTQDSSTQSGPWVPEKAVWTGREAILWGSRGGLRYDPAASTWDLVSTMDAPSSRLNHALVWTGRAMILWGGEWDWYNRHPLASGGRYFPYPPPDDDADGFTVCSGDCDDSDPAVNPSALELPGNMMDEDCDGSLACDPSGEWKSSGHYSRCVARECARLARLGVVSSATCHRDHAR